MPVKKNMPEITRRRFIGFGKRLFLAGTAVALGVGGRKYKLYRDKKKKEAAKRAETEEFLKKLENAKVQQLTPSTKHLEGVEVVELSKGKKVTFIIKGKKKKTVPVLKLPKWINNAIEEEARKKGIRPNLIKCIVCFESGGNPYAVSSAWAKGILQLKKEAAKDAGINPNDLFDVRESVKGACNFLNKHRKTLSRKRLNFRGKKTPYNELPEEIQLALALSAYRWGMGNLEKEFEEKGTVEGVLNRFDYVRDVIVNSYHMDGMELESELMRNHLTVLLTEDVLIRAR